MNRNIKILFAALTVFIFTSCGANTSTSSLNDDLKFPEDKIPYEESHPKKDQTWTEYRVQQLNIYLSNLKAAADEYASTRVPAGSVSKIVDIDIGFSDESDLPDKKRRCFYEKFGGLLDLSIKSDEQLEDMKAQARETVKFMTDFYIRMAGDMNDPLVPKKVRICSAHSLGQLMKLDMNDSENKTLTIGVPYNQNTLLNGAKDNWVFYTVDELLDFWGMGVQFTKIKNKNLVLGKSLLARPLKSLAMKFKKNKIKSTLWLTANPIGAVRNSMRAGMESSNQTLLKDLKEQRLEKDSALLRSKISDVLKVYADESWFEERKVSPKEAVSALSDGHLSKWLDSVEKQLNDRSFLRGLEHSFIKNYIKEAKSNSQKTHETDVDVELSGLIVIGNVHDISVSFDASIFSGGQKYAAYTPVASQNKDRDSTVPTEERTTKVKAKAKGLLVVYTVDSVHVDVKIEVDTSGVSANFALLNTLKHYL